MVTFTLSQSIYEFAKSHAMRAMCASVVYVSICQSANKRANVPKVCQILNLVCQYPKGEPIFQLRLPKDAPIF